VSTAATGSRISRELSAICGMEHVTEAPQERVLGRRPSVAVWPGCAEEIAAILRVANENSLAVVPAGGFTQQQTGKVPGQFDIVLFTTRLTEVEHYDPGDLTVGIGAGSTVAQLCHNISKDGLLFAPDPPLWERATIGGLLATGITGPRRHGYGSLRDYCIGIRFVTGDGRKGKGGGRVVKNVAGYDMMKLLIGSWGTLAIITNASFKLFPYPRNCRTFIAEFATAAEALACRDAVMRSPLDPICLELVHLPSKATTWEIHVRASGSDAVLARYRSELGSAISQEIMGDDETVHWRKLADFAAGFAEECPESLVMSFSLPLKDVGRVLSDISTIAESNGLTSAVIGRIGVGHVLAALKSAANGRADFAAVGPGLRNRLPHDASMAILHCPADYKEKVDLSTPTHVESMRAVKRALDPKDILNRGRFLL